MNKVLHKTSFILLVLLLSFSSGFAQKAKIKKAEKEYEKFAYINAQTIYLEVVEDGYKSAEIYKKLGNTYYFNGDYSNAAKWYERLIEEFPDETEAEYYFKAAQSYKSENRYKESDALMETFAELGGDKNVVQNYQNNPDYLDFISSKEIEFVIEKTEINSEYSDFGPSYYQKDKIVFASASALDSDGKSKVHDWNNQPFFSLYIADLNEDGNLSNVEKLEGEINTKYHESSTTFTKDGNTVYFTRNNFIDGKKGKDKDKNVRLKVYKATKIAENTWTNIEELPFTSDDYSVAHPALSPDEKRLYFSSDMPGTVGQSDLWYVDILDDNNYGDPVNLGATINTEARESFPFVSKDSILYFASDGRAGLGGLDIFYTPLDDSGMPKDIFIMGEPVNSNKDDFGFIFDKETKIGFLSSNRGTEGAEVNVDDIYRIREICQITLQGQVTDKDTGDLLPGSEVILLDKDNKEIERIVTTDDATFEFEVDCETQYAIRASKEEYTPEEKVLTTPEKTSEVELPIALERIGCPPNDLGCKLTLQPIYFDFDRYNIRPDAEIELAKILAAMREYPELVIHIESHTDSRGSDSYNELLSEKRAQSTLEWLVSKGVSRDRLSAKGYGESRLINDCDNNADCTEKEHQLNRRSMFIIQD